MSTSIYGFAIFRTNTTSEATAHAVGAAELRRLVALGCRATYELRHAYGNPSDEYLVDVTVHDAGVSVPVKARVAVPADFSSVLGVCERAGFRIEELETGSWHERAFVASRGTERYVALAARARDGAYDVEWLAHSADVRAVPDELASLNPTAWPLSQWSIS